MIIDIEILKFSNIFVDSHRIFYNYVQEIPIVIAGNKSDLATSHREIALDDVSEWLYCDLPKMRAKVFECSAKTDHNVSLLFKTLLSLSRILPVGGVGVGGTANAGETALGGLKRRSSAYVSATSKGERVDVDVCLGCWFVLNDCLTCIWYTWDVMMDVDGLVCRYRKDRT